MTTEAKRAHEAWAEAAVREGGVEKGIDILKAVMLAGGAPKEDLPELLSAAAASAADGDEPLPPHLQAIYKP